MSPVFDQLRLLHLAGSFAIALAIPAAFAVVIALLERHRGLAPARYASAQVRQDLVYTVFYKTGIYRVAIQAVVTNLIEARMPGLSLQLLRGIPWPVGLAAYWIGGDLLTYWWHRLQHHNRFLWALHSVHHSQEEVTLFTASRRHPLENLSVDVLLYFGVFHLLLGIPTQAWMPLSTLIASLTFLHHAQLDWRYGWLGNVFVSPHFHAFHHSADGAHANANFGFLFSFWDRLFGTAVEPDERPVRYGVPGLDVGSTVWAQVVRPLALMWRWRRAMPPADAPADAPGPTVRTAPVPTA